MKLDTSTLLSLLIEETINHCGHEKRQGQLSMSWLHLSIDEILHRVLNGCYIEPDVKIKLYQGTYAEAGLRERLEAVCTSQIGCSFGQWNPPRVLSAYEGRLTGHTDGSIGRTLVEIKTIPDVRVLNEMKQRHKLPFKVFSQMNSYMLWGGYDEGIAVYETRVEGELWIVPVTPNKRIQEEIKIKAEAILEKIEKFT